MGLASLRLNLVPSRLVGAVDRLALTTGNPVLSPHKRETGYRYEPAKFETGQSISGVRDPSATQNRHSGERLPLDQLQRRAAPRR